MRLFMDINQGVGGPGPMAGKQPGQRFFVVSFSLELILQLTEGVQWFYYRENYTFLRIQRGSSILQCGGGGVQLFPYVNFYRNPYIL